MTFQLWYKDSDTGLWRRCEREYDTLEQARQQIKADLEKGLMPELTQNIHYSHDVKVDLDAAKKVV